MIKLLLLLTLVVLTSADNVKPKKSERPKMEPPETLTDADIAKLAPKIDGTPTGKNKESESAGTIAINPLIIGGTQAIRGQFPWQVALVMDASWFCGGSLISGVWVLTAAHCAQGIKSFEITLGATNRGIAEDGVIKITSNTAIVNSKYSPSTIANDIALVKLPRNISLEIVGNNFINTILLPRTSDGSTTFEGTKTTLSGWGLTKDGGSVSPVLNNVNLIIASLTVCTRYYGKRGVTNLQICCGSDGGLRSSCNGDSGGPLVYEEVAGKWVQLGIVSFGSSAGCASGAPSVYTRVSSYLNWISQNTNIFIRA